MNILISGGTGLIGSSLIAELAPAGHRIFVLSRSKSGPSSRHSALEYIQWDAKSPGPWTEVVDQSEVVINLAGENIAGKGFFPERWTPDKRQKIIQSRVRAGQVLSEAIASSSSRPQLLVQASGISYYPFHQDDRLITESHPPGEGYLSKVALAWEKSTEGVLSLGVSRVVIRIGMVLSTEGGALPRMLLTHRLFVGGPFGTGQQWYSWIHIQDLCRAIHHLIGQPGSSGVYNFTAPSPVRNRTFSRTLGEVLSRPSYLPLPGFVLRIPFGEVADVVLLGQRVYPDRLIGSGFPFLFPELVSALEELISHS